MRYLLFLFLSSILSLSLICSCGSGGEDCAPNDRTICRDGMTYWVDSCGNEGNKAGDCDCGCNADFSGCKDQCCEPECGGKECGEDGCGGTCGDCDANEVCSEDGACVPPEPHCETFVTCDPQCDYTTQWCDGTTCKDHVACDPACEVTTHWCNPESGECISFPSACDPACGATQWCDDGTCKDFPEVPVCNPPCAADEICVE